MFLRRLTLDEIKHSWRTLHAKEASHQSAECTSTNLYSFGCRQLDLLAKQGEIDTDDYQCNTENPPQYVVFNAGQSKDGYCRYNNKRQQYRPKSFPSDIASHSPHDDSRGGSIVIMKMPKPKPVVRCTKLAPMLNRNMAITRLLIFFPFSPCFQMVNDITSDSY